MKIPWLEDFEDSDVKGFLGDLEDVAEVSELRTDGGKIAAIWTLLKGRANMVLQAARSGPAKMEWAAAKEVLLAEFHSITDRQEAMRQFKTARLGISEDPLVYLVRLQKLLDRAMPDFDAISSEQLVADRYVDGLKSGLSTHLRVARVSGRFGVQALVRLTRELIYNGVTVYLVVSEQPTSWHMPTTTGVPMLFGEDRKIVTSADLSSPLMTRDTGSVSLPQFAGEPSEFPTAKQQKKSDNQATHMADISTTINKPVKLETTQSTELEVSDGEVISSLTRRSLKYGSASLGSYGHEEAGGEEVENSREEVAKEHHSYAKRVRATNAFMENIEQIHPDALQYAKRARDMEQQVAVTAVRIVTNEGCQIERRYDPGGTRCKWKDPPWENRWQHANAI